MKSINFKSLSWGFASLLSGIVLLSSCEGEMEVVQVINEEFSEIESIEIESGFLDVNYQGDPNATTVTFDALMESNNPGRFIIEYRVEENKLIIDLDQTGSNGGGNNRGYLNLTGPEMMALDVEVGAGETVIKNIQATNFEIITGSGSVDLANIAAPAIVLKVGSGSINGSNLVGNLSLEVSSGNTTLTNVTGNINAIGSSGKLTLTEVDGIVNAKLSSGNMVFDSVRELGQLQISSGNIDAVNSGLSRFTGFTSSSGNVRIQTLSNLTGFNYDLNAGSGKITVGENVSSGSLKINNGALYTIIGTVSSGSIVIKN
ncbi:MAG: DUF4097 family beta strand repeat-containing protein [Algoriphagus sp.]|nr:DUF4097 family beta strand repeat-containing protein [Algoriphagus sp.]